MGRGIALILVAAFFWGTSGTASTYAPASANAQSVGAVRVILGALGLLVLAYVRGRGRQHRRLPWHLVAVAAVALAVGQLSFFMAIDRGGVAASTVLAIGIAPVFTGMLGAWYLHEKLGRVWVVATTLAIIGATVMVLGAASAVDGDPVGLLFGLIAGGTYAIFVTASKRMIELGHDAVDVTAAIFAGAAIVLLPVLMFSGWQWILEPRGMAVALYLGFATNTLPYMLFGLGLALVPAATAATLGLMEPFTATVLGVVWLGERLAALQWIGALLLLLGLLVLAIPARFRPPVLRPA